MKCAPSESIVVYLWSPCDHLVLPSKNANDVIKRRALSDLRSGRRLNENIHNSSVRIRIGKSEEKATSYDLNARCQQVS